MLIRGVLVKSCQSGVCFGTFPPQIRQSQRALESGGGWLPWQQDRRSSPSFRWSLLLLWNLHQIPFSGIKLRSQYTLTAEGREGTDTSPGLLLCLHGTWCSRHLASQGGFEGCGLYCVCRKMERKLPDGDEDSKTTRRKEKCYSLTQEGCQFHLWIKQLYPGKVCHRPMWRGQRN